jgi:hypothetical protein
VTQDGRLFTEIGGSLQVLYVGEEGEANLK